MRASSFACLEYAFDRDADNLHDHAALHIHARADFDCILVPGVELFSNCCSRARTARSCRNGGIDSASQIRLYARVTSGLTIRADPNDRVPRLQVNLSFAARYLDNARGRGEENGAIPCFPRRFTLSLPPLFTRLPRHESLARFSHGALLPLRVGEACE